MSMKKKIRRAFDAATPNVLDRVLQECPQQDQPIQKSARKTVPHWVKETAATAAALALLIGICGGTIRFGLDGFRAGSTEPTESTPGTTGATETPTESTDPTGYDVSDSEVDFDALPDHCKTLIDPQWDETSEMNTAAAYVTELNEVIVYHIEIQHSGYWYYFDFDAYTAELVDIGLIPCDCIKEGYISQNVVREILNLAHSIQIGDDAEFVLTDDYTGTYYAVFPFGTSLSSSAFYVNAYSGEILDLTDPDAVLSKALIRDVALAYADAEMEDVRYLDICTLAEEEKYYVVEIIVDTNLYAVSVNYNGTVLDCKAEQTNYTQWTDVMVWQDARDIALEDLGITLRQITGLEFSYNDVNCQYAFSFEDTDSYSYHTVVDNRISPNQATDSVLRSFGIYSRDEAQDLTCEYDDSDEADPRYNITFIKEGYLYFISMNAITGQWANWDRTLLNQDDSIIPDENDIEFAGTSEDGLPIIDGISANDSANGFYWDHDGSTVLSIHNGTPELLSINEESISLTHDGKTYNIDFKWCTNAGQIGVYSIGTPSVESIVGNDQYVVITVYGDYHSQYSYLMDLQAKEIIDPFKNADTSTLSRISRFVFSPSGEAALLHSENGLYYLNISTGKLVTVTELTGFSGEFGVTFVDDQWLAITEIASLSEYTGYADCTLFNLTDGSTRTVYDDTPSDVLSDYYGMQFFGRIHVHKHNSEVCVIDCLSGTHAGIGLPDAHTIQACSPDSFLLETFAEDDIIYLVKADGTVTPVCVFGQVYYYV